MSTAVGTLAPTQKTLFSAYVSLAFVDVLLEASGDPDFCAKAGRYSASPEALGT